jgi:hypothetical protein
MSTTVGWGPAPHLKIEIPCRRPRSVRSTGSILLLGGRGVVREVPPFTDARPLSLSYHTARMPARLRVYLLSTSTECVDENVCV